jgi:CDP-diacylglycerol pyrophosphatase
MLINLKLKAMLYKKISKARAKSLYNNDKEIYLHTNKLSYNNPWQNPHAVKIDREEEKSKLEFKVFCDKIESENEELYNSGELKRHVYRDQFTLLVNNYSYYNCDKERGNVVIYLIEDK